jgi:hypothetical protein
MKTLFTLIIITLSFLVLTTQKFNAQSLICNSQGNLIIYSNYDGGLININVDVNIPNLKIGICTYEAALVNITGTFSNNVTKVVYAGFNGNSNNCSLGVLSTSITGVSPSITAVNFYPAVGSYTPTHGHGSPNIVAGYSCDTLSNQGGANTADEIVYYFTQVTGGTMRSHHIQYGCWTNTTFNVSLGGNCCITFPQIPCIAPAAPTNVTALANLAICATKNTTLTATSSGTVNWYSTATSTAALATGTTFITPNFVTAGTYTLYAATHTCTNSITRTPFVITVNPLPTLSLTASPATVCILGLASTLNGSPQGGVYSGPNVIGNSFIPGIIVGPFIVAYNYTNTVNGCSNTQTLSIFVSSCLSGSIKETDNFNKVVQFLPNPSNGVFTLVFNKIEHTLVTITDLQGKIVLQKETKLDNLELDMTGYANGIYVMEVNSESGKNRIKLIKE